MRPDRPDAELVADDPERLGQLVADVVAAGTLAPQQQREVLRADDRLPGPMRAGPTTARASTSTATVAAAPALAPAPSEAATGADSSPTGASIVGTADDGVPATDVRPRYGRVDIRPVRHRKDVAAAMVDRRPRPVGRRRAMHEVAGRAIDR